MTLPATLFAIYTAAAADFTRALEEDYGDRAEFMRHDTARQNDRVRDLCEACRKARAKWMAAVDKELAP